MKNSIQWVFCNNELFIFSLAALLDQYNFKGRYDLVKFIREIHAQGLYVSLRLGLFVESEWKYEYESMKYVS